MFNYSKIALGVTACIALSGCLEVEDNNNDALVAQLEQQNQILQDQLDHQIERSKASKTAITLSGSVKLATEGDTLADDVTVTLYYNGKWHDAVMVDEAGNFEIAGLPSNTDVIAQVSSPSNAIMTRNFFFETDYSNAPVVQNVSTFEVGQPETLEFTVLEEGTNLPFEGLVLEAHLNGYHNGWVDEAIRELVEDNVSKATLNSETGNYELVVPKGINTSLSQTTDLDADGMDDVEGLGFSNSYQLKFNPVTYLSKIEAEQFKLALTFLAPDGSVVKPDNIFATNNDFGENKASFDDESQSFTLDANYYGNLEVLIPSFTANDITYQASQVKVYNFNENSQTYYVRIDGGYYYNVDIVPQDNIVSVAVRLRGEEQTTPNLELVSTTQNFHPESHAFTYYFNAPIEVGNRTEAKLLHTNALVVTKGNASTDDNIAPGTTEIRYEDVEVPVTTSLAFNDTALTVTPNSKLVEGGNYTLTLRRPVNKQSGYYDDFYDNKYLSVMTTTSFAETLFKADNFNYRKNGKLITATNTAGVESADYSSEESSQICVLIENKYNVSITNVEVIKAVANGQDATISNSWVNSSGSSRLYQLAANEWLSWYTVEKGAAVENGSYNKSCLSILDDNSNNVMFKDHTNDNENSITVEIEYRININGNWETKYTEQTLNIN
ncbi:hypothetical protein CWB73_14375 [Pseudoalteromonas phenolica]|uniref:Uncharacterized protein n=1 Tax=Pseudoalteromonas phenolica TaxID=161398 RepID=A0A5S3YSM2_9GAMM|nr:hypothetical protein [Pseudoalteromonas phenolica]TMP79297.1 hypothetical protein CWB73_14375 [Pseudoalteromonas phenolica]